MKKRMKEIKWSLILLALLWIAIGIVTMIWTKVTQNVIVYSIASVCVLCGAVFFVEYMKKEVTELNKSYELVAGFSLVLAGILMFVKVDKIVTLIPIALAFIITISGVMKIQKSLDLLKSGYGFWAVAFILAVVNIVYGIVLLIMEIQNGIPLGIGFIYAGATDLYVTIAMTIKLSQLEPKPLLEDDTEGEDE